MTDTVSRRSTATSFTVPAQPGHSFVIEADDDASDGTRFVSASGEIDLTSSPAFQERIEALVAPRAIVVLDLSEVAFIDSTGLRTLWTIRQRFASVQGRLLLSRPSPSVARLLALTKLDKVFEFVDPDDAGLS